MKKTVGGDLGPRRRTFAVSLGAACVLIGVVATACDKTEAAPAAPPTVSAGANGLVRVTVSEGGFAPSSVKAKKGEPLHLEFTRTTDKTCATQVSFPELNLTRDLPVNKPVAIEIPTEQARSLTFQCGMGMFKSSVVID